MAIDPLTEIENAAHASVDGIVDVVRRLKAETINRPLIGRKLTAKEQQEKYVEVRDDPAGIGVLLDDAAAQYGLQPGQISRRVVDYILAKEKEKE